MNVPLSFSTRYVAPLVPEFSRSYPEVKVELGSSNALLDLIASSWDLAQHNCLSYTLSAMQDRVPWVFGTEVRRIAGHQPRCG